MQELESEEEEEAHPGDDRDAIANEIFDGDVSVGEKKKKIIIFYK